MSLVFRLNTHPIDWDDPQEHWVNLANVNAQVTLGLLEIPYEPIGSIRARDLKRKCDRKMALAEALGLTDYHYDRIRRLRDLAIAAGDLGFIVWS